MSKPLAGEQAERAWEQVKGAKAFDTAANFRTAFMCGFDAGVGWQRGQGDSLCVDLLSALSSAIKVIENTPGEMLGGKANRIADWQRIIDGAEERA